jgi:D-arabinose 1-dehydrogenase-like Zn-dependent alcohol dehydrogenase
MARMRAVQVARAKGPFELVEREIPQPGNRQVRVKVQACGVCHSDSLTKDGLWPGIQYPRVPGHEIAGVLDAVGAGVPEWKPGQRVGVGWYGGHDGYCESCRRGDFLTCQRGQVTGISFDGGYAEYVVVPFETLARIPDELADVEAAPLMCAGVTTFNSLRHSGALAGDLVGVLGIGGLGHLAVQFAARMGCRTVAIARGKDKEPLARELGARVYLDSQTDNVAGRLQELGGASVVMVTAASGEAASAVLAGLRPSGKLIMLGLGDLRIDAAMLISARRSIQGWPSGTSIDSEDTMAFSVQAGVRPMIETIPLERAAEGFERMASNRARFRVVLTIDSPR